MKHLLTFTVRIVLLLAACLLGLDAQAGLLNKYQFLNPQVGALRVTSASGQGWTNLNSALPSWTFTNCTGTQVTNYVGLLQVTGTNSYMDWVNMLQTVPLWGDNSATPLLAGQTGVTGVSNTCNAIITIKMVGGSSSATGTVTFGFAAVANGVDENTDANHIFTLTPTATGVTPTVQSFLIPSYQLVGAAALRLKFILTGTDTVWVQSVTITGFSP